MSYGRRAGRENIDGGKPDLIKNLVFVPILTTLQGSGRWALVVYTISLFITCLPFKILITDGRYYIS